MDDKTILRKVADTVTEKKFVFEIDVSPKTKYDHFLQVVGIRKKKRKFLIRPLKLGSLYRISLLVLKIDPDALKNKDYLDAAYKLMKHTTTVAKIVAVAVTNQEKPPDKELVKFMLFNLVPSELQQLLTFVLVQLHITDFTVSITSIRSLNILEDQDASVRSADEQEVNPQTQGSEIAPGILSAV